MTYRNRLGKAMMIIGVTLIIASFSGSVSHGSSTDVSYGAYEGILLRAAGDVHLEVTSSEQKAFSLYIMSWDDFIQVIQQNCSMDGCTLLLKLENITSYSDVLSIPVPGWFGILTTPAEEGVTHIHIHVDKLKPSTGVSFPGIMCISVGILLILPWSSVRAKTRHFMS